MISVCMTTYNGGLYIKEQIESILPQLNHNDELIICDDGSTDNTIEIISSFNDNRIIFIKNSFHNHILNFEDCLKRAKGNYIFLSDQDDVWVENKIKKMLEYLQNFDLVCSNCIITDKYLYPDGREFRHKECSKLTGFWKNFMHNQYLGCCMAFNRKILNYALPFPKNLKTHDTWIGLIGEIYGKTIFIEDKLIFFRRHDSNTSNTLNKSNLSLKEKISYRLTLLKGIINNYIHRNVNIQR